MSLRHHNRHQVWRGIRWFLMAWSLRLLMEPRLAIFRREGDGGVASASSRHRLGHSLASSASQTVPWSILYTNYLSCEWHTMMSCVWYTMMSCVWYTTWKHELLVIDLTIMNIKMKYHWTTTFSNATHVEYMFFLRRAEIGPLRSLDGFYQCRWQKVHLKGEILN